ncbi:MAG TPA: thiamine pyrophosphate-requiring protein [Dehalococcoidia bacterium]|nr:thiamine pyrophosphate-requiring protein [Dehalococcoidia bacterium]
MRVVDAIVEILRKEGVEFLSCYPATPLIDAAAAARVRPIVCRQERVGVGIADGFSRISNGRRIGVFAMQFGPGAENAFSGIATAYSDSVPLLLLPWGHSSDRAWVKPYFSAVRSYDAVTKWVEPLTVAEQVSQVMRRAFSLLRMGKPGPVMVELPADIAEKEIEPFDYQPVKVARAAANPRDVDEAAKVLVEARSPVIHAGQGVLYAEASDELLELAELLQAPVMTTLMGKSAFPENHPLSLGTGARVVTGPVHHFLAKADVVFGIGCSFSRHYMSTPIPAGKILIHATNNEGDINKYYPADYPIIGDAKLVLRQFIEAVKERLGAHGRRDKSSVAEEIKKVRETWLKQWLPKLTSDEVPINPYRVIWELVHTIDPKDAIVTHDAGSPRDQLVPFYPAVSPRGYIGWGKSHGLGTGLGLNIGAKLAQPDKVTINFMGDAAFGMVGLDFETAVRNRIPIITVVLNNFSMAIETTSMPVSHELYRARDIGGNYADMGRAMGGYAERIENPAEIAPAFQRARRVTQEEGRPVLLEFITSEEIDYSLM